MASKTSKLIVASVAGVVVVGGVVAAAVLLRSEPPPPAVDAPPTDIMRFAASERWTRLPADQLQKYYDRFDQMSWPERMAMFQQLQELTEDERRRALENFFGTRMLNQARQYVRLSPEEQKRELDRLIDQQQSMMANMPRMPFPTTRPGGGEGRGEGRGWGGGGGWNNPAAQKERLERLPPGDRAAMSKFIGDLAQRRAERGLGGWGPGGGGGGGWGGRPGSGGGSGGGGGGGNATAR